MIPLSYCDEPEETTVKVTFPLEVGVKGARTALYYFGLHPLGD